MDRISFRISSISCSSANPQSTLSETNKFLTWQKVSIIAGALLLGAGILLYLARQNYEDDSPICPVLRDDEFCKNATQFLLSEKYHIRCGHDKDLVDSIALPCNIDPSYTMEDVQKSQYANGDTCYLSSQTLRSLAGSLRNPNHLSSQGQCKLDKTQFTTNEQQAIKIINKPRYLPTSFKESQEYLRLSEDDPREKSLFLSSKRTGNTHPLEPIDYSEVLQGLNQETDLKYKSVAAHTAYREICHEIKSASKLGKIRHLYIQGDRELLLEDAETYGVSVPDKTQPFSECYVDTYAFEKVKPEWRR